ncbi:MAG: hypothetical protein E5Y73_30145 [Mesorhizobium sp.]|uniref:hypothetical protein n=1 Tax=Mesorhizobium sp. TaxID=1871066 RepID=UPI00121B1111|nr:hypothetical protein [Mesorhizobium sp.]TIL85169.1 MAG: hypothetical protein E5Y73_30145 [Mesorhizobium sp.]
MTKSFERASGRANAAMRKSLEDLARSLMSAGAAIMADVTGSVVTTLEEIEGVASALIADKKAQITAELSARTEGTA